MLTSLRVKNFKRLRDVEVELGERVLFVGPNNSGKTAVMQALALWQVGLRKWIEKRKGTPGKRPGVTINRKDLIAVPVPDANLLWRDLHVRSVQRTNCKQDTTNIRIDILVTGVTGASPWECGFEFDYANAESFYCRPMREDAGERMQIPEAAKGVNVAFLPPMSGLAAIEDRLHAGAIDVRIGEGRTAEVLRNLCYRIREESEQNWGKLVEHIRALFGVVLNAPEFMSERGQITMSYEERGVELDLVSAGRGLQQTLLLLAHLYTHPRSVLLLDEPDAHLEILRQRQIYQLLTSVAAEQECQVIAASHSEVLLNEAADRDVVIAFVGQPHRIDDRGSQLAKSLKSIGFEQYYQAEQTGWVLYLEGSTDLEILRSFAERLDHPAKEFLKGPFVRYTGNVPTQARDHFHGLREARSDLVGISIYDRLDKALPSGGNLAEFAWRQREVENYLCFPETLAAYARHAGFDSQAMEKAVNEVAGALRTLGKPDPFGPDIKASDEFLGPVFERFFQSLELPNLMRKTDYHVLVPFVPLGRIDPEIPEKLDQIVEIASRAKPVT